MKRAIYIGKTEEYPYQLLRHPLHYGMTGEVRELASLSVLGIHEFCGFYPDGNTNPKRAGSFVTREDIYIPAEDQTSHCPKPS